MKSKYIIIFVFVLLVFVSYSALLFFLAQAEVGSNSERFYQVLNSFEALDTLFSALAFAGLIVTILFQKEQTEIQLKNLIDSSRVSALAAQHAVFSNELEKLLSNQDASETIIPEELNKIKGLEQRIGTIKDELEVIYEDFKSPRNTTR